MQKFFKKAQMPAFAWVFSVIVGAILLFFAFYLVFKVGGLETSKQQITMASSINVLLEPFYGIGSLAEARAELIELPRNYYIEIGCDENKDYSEIKVKEKKEKTFHLTEKAYNKYIFSEPITIGNKNAKVFVFSVPLKKPFYIANIVAIASKGYCFVNFPYRYKQILESIDDNINETGFNFTYASNERECPEGYIKVCLGRSGCNINIECLDGGLCNYGQTDGKYWFDNLIFASIFSQKDVYNCNLNRILKKLNILSKIYKTKAEKLRDKGCDEGGIIDSLGLIETTANQLINNKNEYTLRQLYDLLDKIDNQNYLISPLDCRI